MEKGTIHTKRRSQEDPTTKESAAAAAATSAHPTTQQQAAKQEAMTLSVSLKSAAGNMASSASSAMVAGIQRVGEKVRALSGSTGLTKQEVVSVLSMPVHEEQHSLMTMSSGSSFSSQAEQKQVS